MDIFETIEQDHQVQRELMEKILATSGDSEERRELFSKFRTEFEAHAAAEEHAFYAEMMKHESTTDQSRHSVAEHSEAIELIEKLEKTEMSNSAWLTTFQKLAHENEHHMKEEEEDVFPLVKKEFDKSLLDKMVPEFNSRKKSEELA